MFSSGFDSSPFFLCATFALDHTRIIICQHMDKVSTFLQQQQQNYPLVRKVFADYSIFVQLFRCTNCCKNEYFNTKHGSSI